MRVMTYNIEKGFQPRKQLKQERLVAAKRVVNHVNPDVLCLIEANKTMNYKRAFGFPHSHHNLYNSFDGMCILSRIPMDAEDYSLEYKGAIRAQVGGYNIDVIHPSYSTTDKQKIANLQELIESHTTPYILTGDFNTTHPQDPYPWKKLKKHLRSFVKKNKKKTSLADMIINNWQEAEFVRWLQQQGIHDAFPLHRREGTVNRPVSVRMDFFFTKGVICRDAYVIKNKDTKIASDHFPIVAEFE